MNAITLGDPNLFVKGIVEVLITDPQTGNIIGFDNVATEGAVNTSVNMGEITGGVGNPLLINIPDTTRITGTLTSQAFSMQQRALITGGSISNNGVVSFCETLTADENGILTASRTPVKAYGQSASDAMCWCYVRPKGAPSYKGTNIGIKSLSGKTPSSAAVTPGSEYDVFYFVSMASAKVLALPENFNPSVATLRLKYCVYAKQNNSVSNGTLQGYLYFVVPRVQFQGDAGISANQTSNATTSYDWMAITPDRNMIECNGCGESGADYAYYVYVPCEGDSTANIDSIHLVGGPVIQVASGATRATVTPILLMKDGSIATPDYYRLTWEFSSDPNNAYTPEEGGVSGNLNVITFENGTAFGTMYYKLYFGKVGGGGNPAITLNGTIVVSEAT